MRAVGATLAVLLFVPALAGQPLPFNEVVARLRVPDAAVRLSALKLLVESGYPEAGGPIAALLGDTDERLQRQAVYAELSLFLGSRIAASRRVAFVFEVRSPRPAERAFDAGWSAYPIAPVPIEVVTGLLAPARNEDRAFRVEATYTLGVLGQVDGTPAPPGYRALAEGLAERLADPEPAARIAVARAAGRIFQRCAAPCGDIGLGRLGDALVHTLNDPERGVRLAATDALGALRWDRAIQALTDSYTYYKGGNDALASLVALARIGHAASVPVFTAALFRREDDFRRAAAEGLARVGTKEAAAAVEGALGQATSAPLQLAAAFARYRSGRSDQIDQIVRAVGARATRQQAQEYLIEIGKPAAPPVAAALRRDAARSSPEMRVALVEILGVIAGPSEVAAVEPLLRDPDGTVASAAERATSRMKARG